MALIPENRAFPLLQSKQNFYFVYSYMYRRNLLSFVLNAFPGVSRIRLVRNAADAVTMCFDTLPHFGHNKPNH